MNQPICQPINLLLLYKVCNSPFTRTSHVRTSEVVYQKQDDDIFEVTVSTCLVHEKPTKKIQECNINTDIQEKLLNYINEDNISSFNADIVSQRGEAISNQCADELIGMANLLLEREAE